MTVRYFPATVIIRGDTGISDRQAIDEINELLRGVAKDAVIDSNWESRTLGTLGSDRFRLKPLDPAQFVKMQTDHLAEALMAPVAWGRGYPAEGPCAQQEASCKASDCPDHGWLKQSKQRHERDGLLREIMSKAPDDPPSSIGVSLKDLKEQTERIMATLTPREREVLEQRFGVSSRASDSTMTATDGVILPDVPAAALKHREPWDRPPRPASVLPKQPSKRKRKR